MKSIKKRIYLMGAGLLVLLIILILGIDLIWQHIESGPVIQLPTVKIRKTFQMITERELPKKADGLCAFLEGGRDKAMFIGFETDPEGIAYIIETFGGPPVESRIINADFLKILKESQYSEFPIVSLWEDKLGAHIFDMKSIESAHILEYPVGRVTTLGYKILIDDEQNNVYMFLYSR
jgi:hypothetical protein